MNYGPERCITPRIFMSHSLAMGIEGHDVCTCTSYDAAKRDENTCGKAPSPDED